MNSEEAKDTKELFKMSNKSRSEVGKTAPSVHIRPRLGREERRQSHISAKELLPINSLQVYSESTQLAMVKIKSLYSITWPFGEMSYLTNISTLNCYLNQTLNDRYPRYSSFMTLDTLFYIYDIRFIVKFNCYSVRYALLVHIFIFAFTFH